MDNFLAQLNETDTRKKISTGEEILKYLQKAENSIDCEDIGQFIDGLVPWMQNSNFKVRYWKSVNSSLLKRLCRFFFFNYIALS